MTCAAHRARAGTDRLAVTDRVGRPLSTAMTLALRWAPPATANTADEDDAMGQRVSDSVQIDASHDEVLAVILDLEAYPEWSDDVNSVEVLETDDQDRPHLARFDVDARVAQVDYVLVYDYDGVPDVAWGLHSGEMLTQLDGAYVLEEQSGGTRVTYGLDVDIAMPVPGFLKKRAARTILDTGLRGLKSRVEG